MPDQLRSLQGRDAREFTDAATTHRQHILVHQACVQQFADHKARATCGLELVHIGTAVGIHPSEQWHHVRQSRKVVPIDHNARRTGHSHPMNQVIGRTARSQQGHHGVDNAALVHQLANRCRLFEHGTYRFAREFGAGALMGLDKGRTRHMQTHGFEQHLVAVGGAIKSTGALAVVSRRFGCQQLFAADLTQRRFLAHLGLVAVRQATAHGPGGHKHHGQMSKLQSTNQQARHDLVAHAQHECRIKHIVAQRNRSGHGNHITTEEAQFHARRALGHAIAHGRHATGYLGRGAQFAGLFLDDIRVVLQRRMGREHVVIGVDNANVRRTGRYNLNGAQPTGFLLVGIRHSCKSMGHVGAAQTLRARCSRCVAFKLRQISLAGGLTALGNALGHNQQCRMQTHEGKPCW